MVSLPAARLLLPGCVFGTPWGHNAALSEYRDIKAVLGAGFGSSSCFACSFLPETPRLSQELCWSLGSPPLGPPMISPTLPIPSTLLAPLTLSSWPRAASRCARRDWAVLGYPLTTGVAGGCAGNGWGAGQCQGDAPCATWHCADLSISTGLFLTIFGPFHLFLNVFLLFAQVLCANWELAPLRVGGLSGLPHDRFTLSPCLHILAVWFFCNVLDLDFTSQC